MGVRWSTGTEDAKGSLANVSHPVRCPRGNEYGVSGLDDKLFLSQLHESVAFEYVVDLFALAVAMESCFLSGLDQSLGQTQTPPSVKGRVHEFAYL